MKNILEIVKELLKIISCKQLKKLEQLKTTLKNIKTSKYIKVIYLTNKRGGGNRRKIPNKHLFPASLSRIKRTKVTVILKHISFVKPLMYFFSKPALSVNLKNFKNFLPFFKRLFR